MGETRKHFAVQVVDMLALHLPPKKPFSLLMPMLEEAWQSDSPHQHQAGLLGLAALSDGAGDHIKQRLLPPHLQIVCKGLEDPLGTMLCCLPRASSQRPYGLLSAVIKGRGCHCSLPS